MIDDENESSETRSDTTKLYTGGVLYYRFLTLLVFWNRVLVSNDRVQNRLQYPDFHEVAPNNTNHFGFIASCERSLGRLIPILSCLRESVSTAHINTLLNPVLLNVERQKVENVEDIMSSLIMFIRI